MRISFSPQRPAGALALTVAGELALNVDGDRLSINGEWFDFAGIPEGASLPADAVDSEFVTGEITRQAGTIALTIVLPHGPNPPSHVAFPATIEAADGPVAVPAAPQPEEE